MDRTEEKFLVRKLIKMDESAWEEFCKEYSQPLLNFVRFCLGCNQEESKDIVQMTFVRCVRSIQTFRFSRGRLFQWLKAVAKNEAHSFRCKDQGNFAKISLSYLPQHIEDRILKKIDSAPLPDELFARKELQLLVSETLLDMNSRYREILTMKYKDDLRILEIASKLGLSEKAVESLLSRARESFKIAFLKKEEESNEQE